MLFYGIVNNNYSIYIYNLYIQLAILQQENYTHLNGKSERVFFYYVVSVAAGVLYCKFLAVN